VQFGDEDERTAAAAELGEYILEDAWFAVISHPYALWAHSPDIVAPAHPVAPGQYPHWLAIRPAG
jgi:hypothetical protein